MPSLSEDHLRQALLAVSVLHDIDLLPLEDGVLLTADDRAPVEVPWPDLMAATGDVDPDSPSGRILLDRLLRLARWAADGAPTADVRPLALPVGHLLHPGDGWAYERVLGGTLDLGLGVLGADPRQPEVVLALPTAIAVRCDRSGWVAAARTYLERMAAVASERRAVAATGEPLRPIGDCDVLTLLAARSFRAALTADCGGMTAVAAPMRSRGWTDLRRIDPAFCGAAAAATDDADRGFDRPLLVTADEVQRGPGGDAARIELRDPAPHHRPSARGLGYR